MDLFVVAGEPSADLQGSHLVEALLAKNPHLKISGVAGPRLRALNVSGVVRMEDLQVMGFVDVVAALPRMIKFFYRVRDEILRLRPKAVVCIDYPGFNLRLARSLRKRGYQGKIIHVVCPSVWAWAKWRIPLMVRNLDLLISFLPFEKACFSHTSLAVEYVGHPLVSKIPRQDAPRKNLLALFPGSREKEIFRNFPLQKAVALRLQKEIPGLEVAVSLASESRRSQLQALAGPFPIVGPQESYELMRSSRMALATSGTVTLELALFATPTVVHYAIKPLDQFIAKKIFRIHLPHYCLVNIIAGKRVYPELFGSNFTEKALFEEALGLWGRLEGCRKDCFELRSLLGEANASEEAANQILMLAF